MGEMTKRLVPLLFGIALLAAWRWGGPLLEGLPENIKHLDFLGRLAAPSEPQKDEPAPPSPVAAEPAPPLAEADPTPQEADAPDIHAFLDEFRRFLEDALRQARESPGTMSTAERDGYEVALMSLDNIQQQVREGQWALPPGKRGLAQAEAFMREIVGKLHSAIRKKEQTATTPVEKAQLDLFRRATAIYEAYWEALQARLAREG